MMAPKPAEWSMGVTAIVGVATAMVVGRNKEGVVEQSRLRSERRRNSAVLQIPFLVLPSYRDDY